jgi:hypothetical protein
VGDAAGNFTFNPLSISPGYNLADIGDLTGKMDVIFYNSANGNPGYDNVIPEDVNGDGKTDNVLYDSATGTEYTGISNGDGTFT